jgi:hypothetical protein
MLFLKNKKNCLLLSLLLSSSLVAHAQEPKKNVIDFGKGGKKTVTESEGGSNDSKPLEKQNAIYLDLASAPSGFITLGYERALTSQISGELTGGVTFYALTGELTNTIERLFEPNPYTDNAKYWSDKNYDVKSFTTEGVRIQKIGTYASVSAKFFLEDEVFDGFFVSPRLQYINYNYQTTKPFSGVLPSNYQIPATTEIVNVSKNYFDIIPSIGWNTGGDRIVWSYEFGVGARFATINDYDSGYKTNAGSATYETRSYSNTYVVPMMSSILRMGIKF